MRTLLIIACILTFLYGCEKKDDSVQKFDNYVIAGSGDDSKIIEISPSFISICEKEYYDNGTYHGFTCSSNDSIDLDLDDKFDFKFKQSYKTFTPNDCNPNIIDDCETYGEEESTIQALDRFQIAYNSKETIAPMNFSLKDTINQHEYWTDEYRSLRFSGYGINFWTDSATIGYVGIRMIEQDTIYGWIKLNVTEDQIIIDKYFLE